MLPSRRQLRAARPLHGNLHACEQQQWLSRKLASSLRAMVMQLSKVCVSTSLHSWHLQRLVC